MSEAVNHIRNYVDEVVDVLQGLPLTEISRIIETIEDARNRGKRVFIFGNGGSAATASHFAADLCKGAICVGRPRIKAIALTDNLPLISAWSNDTSYDNIFAEQLDNLLEPEDVVIGISGSGNSQNVLNGVRKARSKGAFTIGFTGFDGGLLKELVDISIIIVSDNMEQIEDTHLLLEHVITTYLRKVA